LGKKETRRGGEGKYDRSHACRKGDDKNRTKVEKNFNKWEKKRELQGARGQKKRGGARKTAGF